MNLTEKTLNYVEVSNKALAEAARLLGETDAVHAKLAEAAPARAQALVALGRLEPALQKRAEQMLANPAELGGLFDNLLGLLDKQQKQASEKQASLGKAASAPSQTQSSEYDSLSDSYIGRRTTMKKASDEAMLRLIPGYSRR